ncbi:MAG: glycosyltransferase family 4 protein [Steroidobacteraceae bacterium]
MRTIGVMGRLLDQGDGLALYGRYLLRHLLLLDRDSRYVIFLASPAAQDLFRDLPNAEPHVVASRSRLLWDQVLIPHLARRLEVDLLFNPKFSLPLLSRIPGVFIVQSCDWYVNPGNYPWWDNLYIRLMLPLYCHKAEAVLAISQAVLDELVQHTGFDLPSGCITHAGVGPLFTAAADPAELRRFRADYNLPEHFILTVARVLHTGLGRMREYPGGNNERLVRAYGQYRRRSADPLPLLVAGKRVREYLRARGFTDAELEGIQFLGFVPNERLHAAYQLADCFVLATLCESFGLPILEALATGCPAIVPNTGAGPEVAAGAARLVDPLSEEALTGALLEVTGSAALRERMRTAGLERATRFGWPQAARRVLESFDRVLAARALEGGAAAPRR